MNGQMSERTYCPFIHGTQRPIFSHSEFAHLFKFLPDVEGDLANFLEDTLEVEILSSDAGLLLSVAYWTFFSPSNGAPHITMRSVKAFFKHRIKC